MVDVIIVPVMGFSPYELEAWPDQLRPRYVNHQDPRPDEPILVHLNFLEAFRSWVEENRVDGVLPDAILYLPEGSEEPEGDAPYDEEVRSGEWEKLERLYRFPDLLHVGDWTDELPMDFLLKLNRPLAGIPTVELPLPDHLKEKLKDKDGVVRDAFNLEASDRLRRLRMVNCPPSRKIADHVKGRLDPKISDHLKECKVCFAEAVVFTRHLNPSSQD